MNCFQVYTKSNVLILAGVIDLLVLTAWQAQKNHICWSVVWCDIEKKNALRKLEIVLNPTLTQIRRGWAPYFLPLSFSPPPMGIRKFLFSLLLSTIEERGAPPSLPPQVWKDKCSPEITPEGAMHIWRPHRDLGGDQLSTTGVRWYKHGLKEKRGDAKNLCRRLLCKPRTKIWVVYRSTYSISATWPTVNNEAKLANSMRGMRHVRKMWHPLAPSPCISIFWTEWASYWTNRQWTERCNSLQRTFPGHKLPD